MEKIKIEDTPVSFLRYGVGDKDMVCERKGCLHLAEYKYDLYGFKLCMPHLIQDIIDANLENVQHPMCADSLASLLAVVNSVVNEEDCLVDKVFCSLKITYLGQFSELSCYQCGEPAQFTRAGRPYCFAGLVKRFYDVTSDIATVTKDTETLAILDMVRSIYNVRSLPI